MKRSAAALSAWWVQRASAAYLLFFSLYFFVSLLLRPINSHSAWKRWLEQPAMAIAFVVFFAALLAHMGVGLRDVLLDYAKPAGLRNVLLRVLGLTLGLIGCWVLWIFFRLYA